MKSLLQTLEPKKTGPILIPASSPRAFYPWRRSLSCLWQPVAEAKLQVVANERWDSHFSPSPYLWNGGSTFNTKHWKCWDPDCPCPGSSSRDPMQGELSWEHHDSCPPTTSILSQLLQWGSHAERCLTLSSRFRMVTPPVTTPSSRALTKRACLGENQATKHTALHFLPKGTYFICNSMKFKPKSTVKKSSVQFSSVTQSCPTLCDPMECSTPGLPVHHQLLELTQTHVHRVGDAIQRAKEILDPEILVKGNWEVILGFNDSIA